MCNITKLKSNIPNFISLVLGVSPQANAGDSRAIACVQGKVQELSHDHKPMHPGKSHDE